MLLRRRLGRAHDERDTIRNRKSSALLLLSGGAFIFMTFMRYSLTEFAWVAFAPLLAFLHDGALAGAISLARRARARVSHHHQQDGDAGDSVGATRADVRRSARVLVFQAVSLASAAHRRFGIRWGICPRDDEERFERSLNLHGLSRQVIDFKDSGSRNSRNAIGASIEPCAEQNHLCDAVTHCLLQEIVNEPGARDRGGTRARPLANRRCGG